MNYSHTAMTGNAFHCIYTGDYATLPEGLLKYDHLVDLILTVAHMELSDGVGLGFGNSV